MYGRGNNNNVAGTSGNNTSGENAGYSAGIQHHPVETGPRARSDIIDYRNRNNNQNNSASSAAQNYDNCVKGLQQQHLHQSPESQNYDSNQQQVGFFSLESESHYQISIFVV